MLLGHSELSRLSFEIGAIRPPSEGGSSSLLIRVSRNCPWNQCAFCYGLPYGHEKFNMRSVEDVKADMDTAGVIHDEIRKVSREMGYSDSINNMVGTAMIRSVPQLAQSHSFINVFNWLCSGAKTAFLQDADSLIGPTPRLVEMIQYLKKKFPTLNRITSYARAKTILNKTEEELEQLCQAGLSRVHIGLETGDDKLLWKVKKGVTSQEHVLAGKKAMKAGIELSEYIMPGLGGKALSKRHAENTAGVLNDINPDFIRSRPFTPFPGTPLFDEYEKGEIDLLSPHECLEEIKQLVEGLDVTSRVCFDHFRNPAYKAESGNVIHLLKQDYDGYKFPEEKRIVLDRLEEGLAVNEERFLQQEDFIRLGSL